MSTDGRRWAFHDPQTVYTQEGATDRSSCTNAVLSDNGDLLATTYGPSGDSRLTVNGTEYGPFEFLLSPSLSPDGTRWFVVFRKLGEVTDTILTESGQFGPFKRANGYFLGDQWVCVTTGEDDKEYLLIDGARFGPYSLITLPLVQGDRTDERDWVVLGFRPDGPVDVFLTGRLVTTTPPFESAGVPASRGPHWAVIGKQDDRFVIVEDGTVSAPLPPFKRLLNWDRSADRSRLALRVLGPDEQSYVLFRSAAFGPYPQLVSPVLFAGDGSHWSFGLFASPPGQRVRVVSDRGEMPVYDMVFDWTVTPRGTQLVGRQGANWWLHIGDERHGPFGGAGMSASEKSVTAVVVLEGRAQVRSF